MPLRCDEVTPPEHSDNTTTHHTKKRRFHKKVRSGCDNCRKRKVKCDEIRPACGNCGRFELHCIYPLSSESRYESKDALAEAHPKYTSNHVGIIQRATPSIAPEPSQRSLPVKRKRGRPRKFVPDPSTPPQSKLDQAPTPHSISSTSHGLPIDDFELLHHYSLHTAPTLTLTPNSPSSWAQKAITLSFASSKHWLIHFPLALSAFHLSRLRPDESSKFFAQGEVHLKLGLAEVAEVVKDLNESNAREVFLATMVLCFATWARGPEEGDLMLISERGEAVWWTMLRGLQAVLLKVGGSGVFADVFDDAEEDEKRVAEKDASRRVEIRWEDEFDAVKSKVLKDDDHSAGPVISALEAMRPAYEATFGTKEEPKMREAVFQVVFGWLFRIGDDFMALLTGRDEAALIVLAHFVVLMNRLPPCWFLEGWVEHILDGIKKCLSDHWKAELAWIEDTLEW